MAFGQYILEMEVRVTEALRNTVDCRCSSKTLELSPCPSRQTTIEILRLKTVFFRQNKSYGTVGHGKKKLKFNLKIKNKKSAVRAVFKTKYVRLPIARRKRNARQVTLPKSE